MLLKLTKFLKCASLIPKSSSFPCRWNLAMYCLATCISVFLVWLVINQLKPYADRVEVTLHLRCFSCYSSLYLAPSLRLYRSFSPPPILKSILNHINSHKKSQEWLRVECILDKNITMTPDADENEHLITDASYPPPYRPNYVRIVLIFIPRHVYPHIFQ